MQNAVTGYLIERLSDKDESLRQDVKAVHPDYTAIRERTLKKLKLGSQSQAGKALDAFIKELLQS